MERFTRKHYGLLGGALILIAAPVAANAMNLLPDFKLSRFLPALGQERARSMSPTEETPFIIERERIILPATDARERHAPARPSEPAATAMPWSGVRTVGEHAYEVPREDVQAAFSGLDELATQARVVPAFRGGQPQGLKLFAIRPHSLFAKLGLVNGDVLQRVNGQSLQTPDSALAAFDSLREARHVQLDLERGGVPIRKTYDVR